MSFFEELKRRNVFRVGIAYGVTAWLLIQISDTVFPRIGLAESAVTLVIALLGIGFVPALLLAWAFEMTPEGIRRERDVDRAESITPHTGKKLDRMIIAALVVVVAWLLIDRYYLETGTDPLQATLPPSDEASVSAARPGRPAEPGAAATAAPDSKSIAVLPFVNMSAEAENEYFSDGISEELLNVLVRVSELEVASRTSSFAYKGKDAPLSQIARELGVSNILEGSVRKAGNRVRITAQLIDADSDRHLWSETYERELDDIFDIQEEISNHIVDALKLALDVREAEDMARAQRPTDNAEAYELYLQGRFKWRQRLEENLRSAIALFEQAIELDPDFAKAHEALAVTHMVLPAWSAVPLSEAFTEATIHSERALAIDPRLAEARAVMAEIAASKLQWGKALDLYETALEFEPRNASVHQWYAENLHDVGYLDESLKSIERAYQIDPASPVINNVYTYIADSLGEDDLAIRRMNTAIELGIEPAVFNAFGALMRQGDLEAIEKHAVPMMEQSGDEIGLTCYRASADPQSKGEARRLVESIQPDPDYGRAGRLAFCSALIGRFDLAFQWMDIELSKDRANIGRYWGLGEVRTQMRQRDEFKAQLEKLKLVDLYRERGWPNRCRPVGAEDFVCE